jgi:hypothetical protein
MKRIFFLSVTIASFIVFACNKEKSNSNEFIPKNETVTIQGKNGITVTASDVYSMKSSFRREIQIVEPKTNTKFPKIFMNFQSDNTGNIYEQLKNRRESVNGTFTIETEGQVIFEKKIVNGIGQKGHNIKLKTIFPNGSSRENVACTVTTVHDCVAWEIDDMNWIEYGFCLAGAPACYASLWASCTWEVCHNNKVYVNPN